MLYSGVSNRSRGWKSKKPGVDMWPTDNRLVRQPSLKKFDGAARSCTGWDDLKKDPELWLRNGNCFVHLYEKGQSQRGPAFRILFASLLAAQGQPLIERFVDRAVSEEEAYQNGRVDLYIPAPAAASRSETAQYHLAIRNFFAWVFRRSMVGRHLGNALIGLANAMDEFRELDADNTGDLLAYLDEEGYLDMRNQPEHALAILHLAEAFQMREMYIDAFAHCVGMSEHLYKHNEYSVTIQRISVASRKLIRRARGDMDFRLSRAGAMLSDLLKEELSEAHVGLSTGARAHLDRFRAYIHGFYTTRFGRFPPPAADPKCSTIFRPDVYCSMRADFEALYQYLVDESFTTTDNAPSVAQGGLCALQSVHAFDLRHNFPHLVHPLPFLPEPVRSKASRRRRSMLWFQGGGSSSSSNSSSSSMYASSGRVESKLRPDQRLVAHAALMRATNHGNVDLLGNSLVLAYRDFEQDSVMIQHKGEHSEKKLGVVTPGDARKVRWLFIYAMYQTLRSCTQMPVEVRETSNVAYHLGVSAKDLPPWQPLDMARHRAATTMTTSIYDGQGECCTPPRPPPTERGRSVVGAAPLLAPIASASASPEAEGASVAYEIKPDIDYFALTHQEESPQRPRGRGRGAGAGDSKNRGTTTPRSRSQSLTRNLSLRRSLSLFRPLSQRSSTADSVTLAPASPTRSGRQSMYHEIIVHGYGNGTNSVTEASSASSALPIVSSSLPQLTVVTTTTTTSTTSSTASRSASTSSTSSYDSAHSSSRSTAAQSLASTTPTTLVDPHSPTSSRQTSDSWAAAPSTTTTNTTTTTTVNPPTMLAGKSSYERLTFPIRRYKSTPRKSIRDMYSHDDMLAAAARSEPPPLPRRSSKRFMRGGGSAASAGASPTTTKRWSMVNVSAELREDASGSEADERVGPRSLRHRMEALAFMEDDVFCDVDEEHHHHHHAAAAADDDDDDWERSTLTLNAKVDVKPPCAWDQFTDLGGLQPIHLLR